MVSKKQSTSSEEGQESTLQSRRMKTLPSEPGTIIHFEGSDLAVVVNRPAGGGAGGIDRPKIDICKCVKTEYKCTTTSEGNTVCKEQCTEWECTTLPLAQA